MIKFFKSLPYHFKNAFKSLRRNIATSVSSATAVTVTLVLVMLFVVIALNINEMSSKVEKSVQVFVQIDNVVKEDEYDELQKQIEAIPNVAKVTFSSKDEQFEEFIKSDEGGEEYEIFRNDNPLTAAFYVDATGGKYVSSVAKECRKLNGVLSANFGGSSAATMIDAFNSIRIGGGIFVLALCFLAVFLINNTIKIAINSRSEEISIMRNVGADNTFIKIPFVIEGMMIGFMGSIIPIIITIFGYGFVYDAFGGQFFSSLFKMQTPMPFVLYVSLLLILVGMLVGMIGSLLSVNKHIKFKR